MWGPLFLVAAPQPARPGSAAALSPSKPGWAQGVTRGVLGSHSLDSRHVWGRHGADFLGFLKGVLLVEGLLFLLLVLQRKEGQCSGGSWGSEGKLSLGEQGLGDRGGPVLPETLYFPCAAGMQVPHYTRSSQKHQRCFKN